MSRERQDEFAARSHRLAAAAWDDGFYDDLVLPVPPARPPSPSSRSPPTAPSPPA
ncbi:hypothetical protein AB0O72_28645 [Streptomyces sp. NPDC088106]|uniref:thiolase family protein n=1 Tax=Streptomyces sp. NPDC088106 TaxID=3154867 RepID=UPI00343F8B67